MRFREDIQGLRAVAVLMVIAHHAFPELLPGGYIGVDIFFVISGYLITNILIEDRNLPAASLLVNFYARRIRRILPIATMAIFAGIIFATNFLGPVMSADLRRDGAFAILFMANWHFNDLAVDYFSAGLPPSIFQHYWSLAVEEQFYLIWPLLIVFTRKRNRGPMVVIAIATILSLSHSIIQVLNGSGTAFFATQTRIWELGFGALVALMKVTRESKSISVISLAMLISLAFLFDKDTGFPGLPALLVVSATTILIATSQTNPLLRNKGLTFIGDISYSLYIWHWIVLQSAQLYLPDSPSSLAKVVLLLGVFGLSVLTYKLIENPIRHANFLKARPVLTVIIGLSIILISSLALLLPEAMK